MLSSIKTSCPTRGQLGYVFKTNNNDACDTVTAPAAPKLSARWPQSIGAGSHLFTERIDDLRPGTNEAPRASHRAYRRCACQRKIPRCGRPEFSKDRPPGLALSAPSLSSTCSMSQEAFRGSGSKADKAEGLSPHAAGLCQTPGWRRRPGEPLLKKRRIWHRCFAFLRVLTGRLQQPQVDPQRIGRQKLSLRQRSNKHQLHLPSIDFDGDFSCSVACFSLPTLCKSRQRARACSCGWVETPSSLSHANRREAQEPFTSMRNCTHTHTHTKSRGPEKPIGRLRSLRACPHDGAEQQRQVQQLLPARRRFAEIAKAQRFYQNCVLAVRGLWIHCCLASAHLRQESTLH